MFRLVAAMPKIMLVALIYFAVSQHRSCALRTSTIRWGFTMQWLNRRYISWEEYDDLPAVVDTLLIDHPQLYVDSPHILQFHVSMYFPMYLIDMTYVTFVHP
jgi:hypothetical protein